jgi:hypothetical protein
VTKASNDPVVGGDSCRQVLPRLYEEIRSWVLDPSHEPRKASRHLGWRVLVQRGMTAWMESCQCFSSTTRQDVPAAPPSLPVPALRSRDAELTVVMASIVLGHIQGAAT